MTLKEEVLALIPDDIDEAEKTEVQRIIEKAFAEEGMVPGDEILADRIGGV